MHAQKEYERELEADPHEVKAPFFLPLLHLKPTSSNKCYNIDFHNRILSFFFGM
jgi:hypothetical protein